MTSKHWEIPFIEGQGDVEEECLFLARKALPTMIQSIVTNYPPQPLEREDEDEKYDPTWYTGRGGVALVFWRLSKSAWPDAKERKECYVRYQEYEKACFDIVSDCGGFPAKWRTVGCHNSETGMLALAAVSSWECGEEKQADERANLLVSVHPWAIKCKYAEVMNGSAGYVHALLFLRTYGAPRWHTSIDVALVRVLRSMIERGRNGGSIAWNAPTFRPPLMYEWHKPYLGAAHGLCGILHCFFTCMELVPHLSPQWADDGVVFDIQRSMDAMLELDMRNGFPSRPGSHKSNPLMQWCHGSPAFVLCCCAAIHVVKGRVRDRYLEVAKEQGMHIWHQGLLKKGFGLCHGGAGNSYAFLALYRVTEETMWLEKAHQFALFYLKGERAVRTPDRPYSLMEGMGGTCVFLADLFEPKRARFPAFEL